MASQRALITGCSTGIGRATAVDLHARGYEVIATARRLETIEDLEVAGRMALDVDSDESVANVVAEAGPIDVLVNNAGFGVEGSIETVPLDEVRRMFETNVFGSARMIQAFLPGMRERGAGTIVNVTSTAAIAAPPLGGYYSATKYAMTAISEALKLEAGHFGIRVFAIEPGVIETSFGANALDHRAEPGPYEELGVLWTKAQEILGGGQAAPGPELVATAIAAALESDGSRLRWPVGQDAELVAAARTEPTTTSSWRACAPSSTWTGSGDEELGVAGERVALALGLVGEPEPREVEQGVRETRSVVEQPSGEVCFLFTDVQGSTRLWAEHTSAMEVALARHDELLCAAIESAGGYVFSTAGDGVGAAFPTAHAAVGAAIAAQTELHHEPWDGLPDGLDVRMGLHLGTAQERARNYFGPVVNLAARVMSAAWGGQVLCTTAVADAVDVTTDPLGEHRLRDVPGTTTLLQVTVPGLRSDFPHVRTLDAAPSTIPAQRATFFGRHDDIAAVRRVLLDQRLVTLTGPGGVGKTRLAIEVAGRERRAGRAARSSWTSRRSTAAWTSRRTLPPPVRWSWMRVSRHSTS